MDKMRGNIQLDCSDSAIMCQYWADAVSISPVLAHNGMFTGESMFVKSRGCSI